MDLGIMNYLAEIEHRDPTLRRRRIRRQQQALAQAAEEEARRRMDVFFSVLVGSVSGEIRTLTI